jgi:transposase
MPLRVTPQQAAVLRRRFDAATSLYNGCLREAFKRLDLCRQSRLWRQARACRNPQERRQLFKAVRTQYGFREYDLIAFAGEMRRACWMAQHIDGKTAHELGRRVFRAVEPYSYGTRGRPRFKHPQRRPLTSLESQSNKAGIRWRQLQVLWTGLCLTPVLDPKDPYGIEAHALQCRTKRVRLVQRSLRGRERWYVQLVQEGTPQTKPHHPAPDGVVGLDLGPSTLAAVGADEALQVEFAAALQAQLKPWQREKRRLQRALDRSRRATNPQNYNPDGTVKRGARRWYKSRRAGQLQQRLLETERRLAATRKRLLGELAHQVVALGSTIKTEKLTYTTWQRHWGASVGRHAPGLFLAILRWTATKHGGAVEEFSTRTTKLSQVCHGCGAYIKKPLSQRVHTCPCGVGPVQRDLYSAFLARHVVGNSLDRAQARVAWDTGAGSLLERTVSRPYQSARSALTGGAALPAPTGEKSGSSVQGSTRRVSAGDGVREQKSRCPESPGKARGQSAKPLVPQQLVFPFGVRALKLSLKREEILARGQTPP